MKKRFHKWVGVAVLTCGATAAWAEGNSRIFREGGDWVQETTGSVPASRTIRIKTRIGTINLTGGSVSNISYTMRWRCGAGSSEEEARRFFESLKVNTGRSGDVTSFVTEGEGRWRRFSAELTINVPPDELLALDEALTKFAEQEPEKAKLVELRYFAGLTGEQAAKAMGISLATADRYWAYARAWLQREVRDEDFKKK